MPNSVRRGDGLCSEPRKQDWSRSAAYAATAGKSCASIPKTFMCTSTITSRCRTHSSTKTASRILDSGERELFISAVCRHCWSLLCPSDPMAYSRVRDKTEADRGYTQNPVDECYGDVTTAISRFRGCLKLLGQRSIGPTKYRLVGCYGRLRGSIPGVHSREGWRPIPPTQAALP